MTATQLKSHPPLAHTFRLAALGLVASTSLFVSSPQAQAGTTEIKFLTAKLSGTATTNPQSISTATSDDLASAVVDILTNNAAKYNTPAKAALVAGEALKYNQNADAAEVLAAALGAVPVAQTDVKVFVAITGKTAGTGKALNVNQIPDFAVAMLDLDANTTAVATDTAKLAKNKPAAGAILGGQAGELFDDTARLGLANTAATDPKLKAGIQDIARYIGAATDESDTFAEAFAKAQVKSALKIAVGVAAGDPTNAGAQAVALYGSLDGTLKATLDKGISTFAKSVSVVSDIEQIPQIANTLASRIAGGTVKLSKAGSVLSAIVKSVLTAPVVSTVGDQAKNRKDEAAEIAAYFVGGLGNALIAQVTKDPTGAKAAKLVYNWIKSSVKAFNNKKLGYLPANVSGDIVGSVLLTIQNLDPVTFGNVQGQLKLLLFSGTNAKKIAAAIKAIEKNSISDISAAIADIYNSTNLNKYEDGTDGLVAVTDPETDIHPFN